MNAKVLIPIYGQWRYLDILLTSLRNYFSDKDVYIADDKSKCKKTLEYLDWLDDNYGYNIIRNDSNLGFGGNVNNAIEQIESEIVFLLNSDTYYYRNMNVFDGCLDLMDDDVAVVGIKLVNSDFRVIHGGVETRHVMYPEFESGLVNKEFRVELRHLCGDDANMYSKTVECEYVTAAFWCVRKSAFIKCGMFKDIYGRGYYEDPDLCVEFRKRGYKVMYDGSMYALHYAHRSFALVKDFDFIKTRDRNFALFWDLHGDYIENHKDEYYRGYKKQV